MNKSVLFLSIFLILSCSVKQKEKSQTTPVTTLAPQVLSIPGVYVGQDKKILFRIVSATYKAGEDNKVVYRIVDDSLRPVTDAAFEIKTEYRPPEFPKMGGVKKMKMTTPGEFEVDYTICCAHQWVFKVWLEKNGSRWDGIEYAVQVPEE